MEDIDVPVTWNDGLRDFRHWWANPATAAQQRLESAKQRWTPGPAVESSLAHFLLLTAASITCLERLYFRSC